MKQISFRLFTEELKREAIKLVTEKYLNAAQAGSRQLDIELLLSLRFELLMRCWSIS